MKIVDGLDRAVEVRPQHWCVYGHYVANELVYIGSGRLSRAFVTVQRTKIWKEATKDGYKVVILQWFEDRSRALGLEKILIERHKPRLNLTYTGWVNPKAIGNSWNIGRKHSDKSKAIMSASQKASWVKTKRNTGHRRPRKKVQCMETGKIYTGLLAASREMGVHFTCISQVINGRRKSAGGYTFIRLEE